MNTGDMLLLLLDRYNREIKISNARVAGLAQSNATKPAPVQYIGVFAGAGYNLANVGANTGVICNVLPDKRITLVITAMYGYNAVIKVKYLNGTDFGVYSGLTVGGGVDFSWAEAKKVSLM